MPEALVEAGMFPMSPERPSGAVHFGLCDLMIRMRNHFAASASSIADFCNEQYEGLEGNVSFSFLFSQVSLITTFYFSFLL